MSRFVIVEIGCGTRVRWFIIILSDANAPDLESDPIRSKGIRSGRL